MTQTMNRQAIENVIIELLRDVRPNAMYDEMEFDIDAPLTGPEMNFTGIQLAYFFFSLQARLGISLGNDDVRDHRFLCIRGIVDRVALQLIP